MTSEIIVTLAITGASWTVFLTTWLTKLSMRVTTAEKQHVACEAFRVTEEAHIRDTLDVIRTDISEIKENMATISANVANLRERTE